MIIFTLILYPIIYVFDIAIIGGAVALFCSKPKKIVPTKLLALILLIIFIIQDILMFLFLFPLDLTIKSNNQTFNDIMGTFDLSDIIMPSFSIIDLFFYAISVAIAVYCGRFICRKYHKIYYREEIL